jgi:hypothetical protein
MSTTSARLGPRRTLVLALALGGALVASDGRAQSAKASARLGNINRMASAQGTSVETPWQTALSATIRTSSQKDLFIGVSLESSLFIRGRIRSRNRTADRSSASAGIEVRVLVDGAAVYPGPVVFNKRRQELTGTFQGILDSCLATDPATGGTIIDQECIEPEDLELLLDTTSANHYTFVADDVGVGNHTVELETRIDLSTSFESGDAEARAIIGRGSLTVEEVRLIKGAEVFEP